MASPTGAGHQRAWYFFAKEGDLPEGETVVPIRKEWGFGFAVRPGAMTQQTLDSLNDVANHLLGLGLVVIPPQPAKPPEP